MENPIPEIEEFVGSDVTEGEFKVALNKLLMYLMESVGPEGENFLQKSESENFLQKSGGATTGPIIFQSTSGDVYVAVAQRTDVGRSIALGIGSGGNNRGIWDGEKAKWLINADANDYIKSYDKQIPTVEASGSDYVRYTDGTQTCWGAVDINSSTQTTITYPVQFLAGSGTDFKYGISCAVNNRSNFYLTPNVNGKTAVAMTSSTGGQRMYWVATGRWK